MKRRGVMLGLSGAAVAGAGVLAARGGFVQQESREAFHEPPTQGTHRFEATIEPSTTGPPANRLLLGQNLQWTDNGDDLLDAGGRIRPEMIDRVKRLQPTSIRFPGGIQSDNYRWQFGMGPAGSRSKNRQAHSGRMLPTMMGTQEFLEVCEAFDAEPFITANIVTGTPAEAADWIRQTNVTRLRSRVTGRMLAKVGYWEIGNEPYLKEDDSSRWVSPAEYVKRADAFIKALRAVDPQIRVGIPFRTEKIGGIPATPYPSFARDVLGGVTERVDFFSNHNAYMPYAYDGRAPSPEVYWSTMAATASVAENLDDSARLVASVRPREPVRQAITEYNALFTLGKGETDKLIASGMGALYVADLLACLAGRDDILLAQYWSLSGNFLFGAIASDGRERPAYAALEMAARVLVGHRIACSTVAETFASPRIGVSAPRPEVPLVTAFATRDDKFVRLLLINKDRHRAARGRVRLPGSHIGQADADVCFWDDPMRPDEYGEGTRRDSIKPRIERDTLDFELRKASIALLSVTLKAA